MSSVVETQDLGSNIHPSTGQGDNWCRAERFDTLSTGFSKHDGR